MSENYNDILGGNDPDRPKVYGLAIRQCARSSFEFEMLARSMESMSSLRAEFGRDDDPVFVEDDDTEDLAFDPDAPDELTAIENAIIAAAARLWVHRIAIARACGNQKAYVAACLIEKIQPF
jgi:hypothetical protein